MFYLLVQPPGYRIGQDFVPGRRGKGDLAHAGMHRHDRPLHRQQVRTVPVLFQDVARRADGPAVGGHHGHGPIIPAEPNSD